MTSYPQSSGTQPFRPPLVGSTGPPQNFGPSMPMQFRPVIPTQQIHHFVPAASQQFRPVGQGMPTPNVIVPAGPAQIPQLSQVIQPIPPISVQPGQGPPSSQAIPMPYIQPIRPISSGSVQSQQNAQVLNSSLPNPAAVGVSLSSSYTFTTSYSQPLDRAVAPPQYQPIPQMQASVTPAGSQPWLMPGTQAAPSVTPMMQPVPPSSVAIATVPASTAPPSTMQQASDWQEHTSPDGKRYYYNKKTRQSCWEKPFELMTPIEMSFGKSGAKKTTSLYGYFEARLSLFSRQRADASTGWKEYTTAEGRKYYYNKVTKQSKWTMPDELKLAREKAEKGVIQATHSEVGPTSLAPVSVTVASVEMPSAAAAAAAATSSSTPQTVSTEASSPVPVTHVDSGNQPTVVASGSPPAAAIPSSVIPSSSFLGTTAVDTSSISFPASSLPASVSASSADVMDSTIVTTNNNHESLSIPSVVNVPDGASAQDLEEAKKAMPVAGQINVTPLEEKSSAEEPLVYANKQEAKNAFKALLESAKIESDWSWDQAMRVIINDKRYTALKTLAERKQAFNEYLGQRKKQESEERRIRQKKAREDFIRMLEECKELKSSTRWSKAVTMLEGDERFNAVERSREREDLFEDYIAELQKKEKAKAVEEHKRNIMEYKAFLESCDFIKANSQWRKVQDRLEEDERCSRLEKIDRLKIFQDYVHDLEKEEEEQRKIQKEQLRREERKNRDEFRKLMEEHVAAGILTAKTQWRDYCIKVKDLPSFLVVSSNTSGATPKDLFEDVAEELEKQYHEDKSRIKDTLKIRKITLASSSTFEDFKAAISEDDNLQQISETNLRLVFDELLERLREKEEKEAKKRQRLADNFSALLCSMKEINAFSRWDECKALFEDCKEYKTIGEERLGREVFEEYIAHLKEKASEKERKRDEEKARKEKEREEKEKRNKERKEREREHEKAKGKGRSKKDDLENEYADVVDSNSLKGDRKKERDKDRKHRKRHHDTADDVSSEIDEKNGSRKSHRHSGERKKSRKHSHTTESDSESRHKKHRRDRDESRNGAYEELEDGELGEDGEIH